MSVKRVYIALIACIAAHADQQAMQFVKKLIHKRPSYSFSGEESYTQKLIDFATKETPFCNIAFSSDEKKIVQGIVLDTMPHLKKDGDFLNLTSNTVTSKKQIDADLFKLLFAAFDTRKPTSEKFLPEYISGTFIALILQVMRECKCDINAKWEGKSAIFEACNLPDAALVEILLQAGAQGNIRQWHEKLRQEIVPLQNMSYNIRHDFKSYTPEQLEEFEKIWFLLLSKEHPLVRCIVSSGLNEVSIEDSCDYDDFGPELWDL